MRATAGRTRFTRSTRGLMSRSSTTRLQGLKPSSFTSSPLTTAFPISSPLMTSGTSSFMSGPTAWRSMSTMMGVRSPSTSATVLTTPQLWATKLTISEPAAAVVAVQTRGSHTYDDSWKATTQVTGVHRTVSGISDMVAYAVVKAMRIPADLFFRKKYIHRAVVLETVAAVPGMVAGMLRHLRSLRTMSHDGGWIHELLDEAENERMHLLTFIKLSKPTLLERLLVLGVQGVFFNVYFIFYILFPRTAHRMVGYLEEEAVISYTGFLEQIDSGKIENVEAPKIAKEYWKLGENARLRDVVLAVQLDEAHHRDVNHRLADKLIPFHKQRRDPQGSTVKQEGIQTVTLKHQASAEGTSTSGAGAGGATQQQQAAAQPKQTPQVPDKPKTMEDALFQKYRG